MTHPTEALTRSMARLEQALTQLEKTKAAQPLTAAPVDDAALTHLQAENATLKKRHTTLNTKISTLIASLEQQLEG